MYSKTEFAKFEKFLFRNERGVVGIKEDAPEEAKEAYALFKKRKEEAARQGIKL